MIGIFDSGSGGLTVLRAVREQLPSVDVLYFGDLLHAPYGIRSQAQLAHLTIEAMSLLRERGARKFISACNSVSTTMALSVFDMFEIKPHHVLEMVGPTVSALRGVDRPIVLIATPATIASGMYQLGFRMVGKSVLAVPLPNLASMIENKEDTSVIVAMLKEEFAEITVPENAILILGCTHYPLAAESLLQALPGVSLFDPAGPVAERAHELFWPEEVGSGRTEFLLSKKSDVFIERVESLFPGLTYSLEEIDDFASDLI